MVRGREKHGTLVTFHWWMVTFLDHNPLFPTCCPTTSYRTLNLNQTNERIPYISERKKVDPSETTVHRKRNAPNSCPAFLTIDSWWYLSLLLLLLLLSYSASNTPRKSFHKNFHTFEYEVKEQIPNLRSLHLAATRSFDT